MGCISSKSSKMVQSASGSPSSAAGNASDAFEMLIVGSGGGPDQTNLSHYLVKPKGASWRDGVLSLEGGSGVGVLRSLLERNPGLVDPSEVFGDDVKVVPRGSGATALQLFSFVRDYAITHAHFDHINALVIMAGSSSKHRIRVHGLQCVVNKFVKAFDGALWPALASFDEDDNAAKYLCTVTPSVKYAPLDSGLSIRAMPISHGCTSDINEVYDSTAFFIRHGTCDREFLFFGDVEPDMLSSSPRTLAVWQAAAPLIPARLDTIFLECSWTSSRPDNMLFGHLTPRHFVQELCSLAREVASCRSTRRPSLNGASSPPAKRIKLQEPEPDLVGALEGVRVYVIHCKETFDDDRPPTEVILGEIRALLVEHALGVEVEIARQGTRIAF